MKRFLIFSLAVGFGWGLQAQVTERERPAEWKNLVEGARFMDRLQPMKGEMLSSDVWGADSVRPRLVDNGIELPETSFWGGNILKLQTASIICLFAVGRKIRPKVTCFGVTLRCSTQSVINWKARTPSAIR